jgi:prolyl oligopeptidase
MLNLKIKMITRLLILCLVLSFSITYSQPLVYPKTKKVNVSDTYFGTTVEDPYRWLEDDRSEETAEWVKEQNIVTTNYLDKIPFRDSIRSKMKSYWNSLKYKAPFKCGNNYMYYRSDGRNNQPILFYMKSLEFVPMMYFDPNKLSEDGTTEITQTVPSKEGTYIAFVLNDAGSDWSYVRIKETKSMKTLPERLENIKFSSIAWFKEGFFYSKYDPKTAQSLSEVNEFHKIYYHQLNSSQEKDSLVYLDRTSKQRNFSAVTTDDQRYLIISGAESTTGNSISILDLSKSNATPTSVVKGFNYDFTYIGMSGKNLLFLTNYKAPQKKIISINPITPEEINWKVIVPEQKDNLVSATRSYNSMLLHYLKDANSKVYVYDLLGIKKSEIPLSGIGTVDEITGSEEDSMAFISFVTFTSPQTIYKFNMKTQRLGMQFKAQLNYEENAYITKQVFYNSKDGTKIPMFIVHKRDIKLDGNNPTLLFGYGGFDISKTPEYKPERLVFLENGGIFVMACLRGGGEYGSAWHEAGTKLKKQNVFDDFIAAAEYLIKEKYTNSDKLAISGRSNGGLLVGATMLQRPDLFKVAVPVVGVMDMLRYHKFTIGWAWKSDYGSSDDSTEFKAIYKYSPLHNVKFEKYPATLITTGDHDDRVVPAHSFKFAATLQEKQRSDSPILIRIDVNAGHGGAGKPTGKLIEEQTDVFSFIFYNLGMTL